MRAVLMLRALGDYGRLMIFPSNLHMERTVMDENDYRSSATWQNSVASEYLSIAGLIFAALLFAGCRWRGHGRPWRIFGTVWFAIGYLPTSNIVELNATCAEHWLYLPSVGLLIFLVGCVLDLPPRWRKPLPAFACLRGRPAQRSERNPEQRLGHCRNFLRAHSCSRWHEHSRRDESRRDLHQPGELPQSGDDIAPRARDHAGLSDGSK